MNAPLLLDTCATVWISCDDDVSEDALEALDNAHKFGEAVFVSPITAWEIGLLTARGKVNLMMPPDRWFERLLQAPGLRLAEMPPKVLIASSFLPGAPPKDPADRIVVATAREFGFVLVTRDKPLLAYAEQGHFRALRC